MQHIHQIEEEAAAFATVDRDRGFESVISSRRFTGHYRGYGVFCTLRCAHAFAEAAFVAGYRMARK